MDGYAISIHVRAGHPAAVRQETINLFAANGFTPVSDLAASVAVEDEDALPDSDDWYGVMVTGAVGNGWVSVYVDDWQDSGVVARGLSQALSTSVLEIWIAGDAHWGYTYYENGHVLDRFTDDPAGVADTPAEAAEYIGHADTLAPVLLTTPVELDRVLRTAQEALDEFAGVPIAALGEMIGLPFEHALIGYADFFDLDPDDYTPDLENWSQFRHLAFQHPAGQDRLS